jgi:hypothetical protein
MEGNDLAPHVVDRWGVMFEGVLMREEYEEPSMTKRWWRRTVKKESDADMAIDTLVHGWKPNDLPVKSLSHLVNKLGVRVDVYTFMPETMVEYVEKWLQRKGILVTVYSYYDLEELAEDFKYSRDISRFYTADRRIADRLGIRATLILPEQQFGF